MLICLGLRPATSPLFTQPAFRSFSSQTSLLYRSIPKHTSRVSAIPLRRHPLLLTTVGTAAFAYPILFSPHTRNDVGEAPYSHGRDAKVPLSKDGGRNLNPAAIRQISFGAIVGLGLGVVVSAFSRMLVLVFGLGIVVAQYAARRGYNIFPVERLQRYVKGVNLRSAINDNAAFKISFGLMFALTAFGEF